MTKLIQNVFKNHPKSVENGTQIFPKSVKIDKNGALGAFGGILGAFGAPGRPQDAKPSSGYLVFFALLAEMDRLFVDFGPQLGRKDLQNHNFWPKVN